MFAAFVCHLHICLVLMPHGSTAMQEEFQAAGGKVALGSDQSPGNNCHNIWNEMKLTR